MTPLGGVLPDCEIRRQDRFTFDLVFHGSGGTEPYVSALYSRQPKETFESAARRICRSYGWDKRPPGSNALETGKRRRSG